jgi:oxygen-independent coproporphyrinogen-3 oxidase
MQHIGIYIHIPFCARKCGYCDFNAYSGYKDGTKARYVNALCREIRQSADNTVLIPTVFFGGGTPTELPAEELVRILETVRESFPLLPTAEISVEANPGDASLPYLQTLKRAGFNRLSFGVQTFNDRLLKTLDRLHSGETARQAVALAKEARFDNLSIDLMFALPRQTLADWERSLDAALALEIPHLSMYSLIVEEGTPFWARRERGKLPLPNEQTETLMFERAIARATEAGLHHYEVSNFARPGFESQHNQIYWRNEEYFGFGAGAVGYRQGVRQRNIDLPSHYIAAVERGEMLTIWHERLTATEVLGETIMVGLRQTEGIEFASLQNRFGVDIQTHYAAEIAQLRHAELLELTPTHLRLTQRGLFLANEVMMKFLP